MYFSFTEEQERFRQSVRSFCTAGIAPRASEIDEKGEISRDLIASMGETGLFGVTVSRRYGGSAEGIVKAAIVAEEIGRADISMSAAVFFLVEAGLERGLRGLASCMMGAEGAQNIMRVIIARELLGREFGIQGGPSPQ